MNLPSVCDFAGVVLIALLLWAYLDWIGVLGPERIKGIPSVPSLPFIGNLHQVNSNPALTYSRWSQKYGDVFQMRLGTQTVVVANSYDSVKHLWISNSNANNSRPVLYTFHRVLSKTQGFTVGTTPWGKDYKNMKKIIATSLNKKSIDSYSDFISFESRQFFRRINSFILTNLYLGQSCDIDIFKLLQGYVLRVSLFITYGYLVKVEHDDNCKLFDEVTKVENKIVRLRGHTSNIQDYLPILRYFGFNKKSNLAEDFRQRRDVYMSKFHDDLIQKMKDGNYYKDCIVSKVLRGCSEYPKEITDSQLNSICLSMVSAGLDNTPLVLNHILGHLSQPGEHAQTLQEEAFKEILKTYGSVEAAFTLCAFDFQVDFITAILKEGLRFFSVLPTSLPRATTGDIIYKDAIIPSGTILFMNAFAANHDSHHFENPYIFEPRRYLDKENRIIDNRKPDHFTFGVGTRACAGSHLAWKEMYITIIRFILLYRILPPEDEKYLMKLDPFEMNSEPDSVAFEPQIFKFGLLPRNEEVFHKLIILPDE
uniref:Cytochrome P450 n=1 Tax=Cyberlindnera americana TaxID=36016 RepID=A0A5P8N8Y0_9ASCO|nr:cytochrome P450 [Cyberlindnera americana]